MLYMPTTLPHLINANLLLTRRTGMKATGFRGARRSPQVVQIENRNQLQSLDDGSGSESPRISYS